MVLRAPLLILAAWLVTAGSAALAAGKGCLRCHPEHYGGQGSCTVCHRGDTRSERLAIAHRNLIRGRYAWHLIAGSAPLVRGERLVERFACRRCHTIDDRGNRLASNLDRFAQGAAPQQMLRSIKTPVLNMPDFACNEGQLDDLVVALLSGGAKAGAQEEAGPQVVHFEDGKSRESVFEKRCGQCHRLLTGKLGGLGRGAVGPNLSGLLTPFFPATWRDGGRWNAERLGAWLENPRKLRPQSQMQPVALPRKELEELLATFGDAR